MKLIESKTLVSAQASIEFTSIPQDFTDLLISYSVRGDNANFQGLQIYFNGANSNLTSRYLLGTGSSAASGTLSYGFAGSISGTGSTSNTFGNGTLYIPNYTGSTNKSFSVDNVTENNATTSYQDIVAGLWSQTAAITSFTLLGRTDGGGSNNLITGSTVSLYGILKGSSGGVTTS
jgi:hypothetical protein